MVESLTKIRHERSQKDFPKLRLEPDEYIEFAFKRAHICLVLILSGLTAAIAVILLALLLTLLGQSMLDTMGRNFLYIILATLLVTVVIIGIIATTLYYNNQLYITNKRVIQKTMDALFANSINMIELSAIEDVSFRQEGILPNMFHYGTLRLATVGDETTYTFKYSDISAEDLEAVTELIGDTKKAISKIPLPRS